MLLLLALCSIHMVPLIVVSAVHSDLTVFAVSTTQGVPEALASTASTHSISNQQLDQLQHQQQHPQQQHPQQEHSTPGATASQSVSPRPAFASSSLAAPVSSSYWSNSAGGWVLALSLLFAVRQGREQADAARLDVRALQARQQDSRVQVG